MSREIVVFHSALAPREVGEALRRSLTGSKGNSPMRGEVREDTFRLRKRRYRRNDFARDFYGRFEYEPGGTRIQGYFDTPRWSRYFMRFWLVCAVLLGTPIFVMTLIGIMKGSRLANGDAWIGLIVPPALVLFGVALLKFGRLSSKGEELFVLQYIENTLAARIDPEHRKD